MGCGALCPKISYKDLHKSSHERKQVVLVLGTLESLFIMARGHFQRKINVVSFLYFMMNFLKLKKKGSSNVFNFKKYIYGI